MLGFLPVFFCFVFLNYDVTEMNDKKTASFGCISIHLAVPILGIITDTCLGYVSISFAHLDPNIFARSFGEIYSSCVRLNGD